MIKLPTYALVILAELSLASPIAAACAEKFGASPSRVLATNGNYSSSAIRRTISLDQLAALSRLGLNPSDADRRMHGAANTPLFSPTHFHLFEAAWSWRDHALDKWESKVFMYREFASGRALLDLLSWAYRAQNNNYAQGVGGIVYKPIPSPRRYVEANLPLGSELGPIFNERRPSGILHSDAEIRRKIRRELRRQGFSLRRWARHVYAMEAAWTPPLRSDRPQGPSFVEAFQNHRTVLNFMAERRISGNMFSISFSEWYELAKLKLVPSSFGIIMNSEGDPAFSFTHLALYGMLPAAHREIIRNTFAEQRFLGRFFRSGEAFEHILSHVLIATRSIGGFGYELPANRRTTEEARAFNAFSRFLREYFIDSEGAIAALRGTDTLSTEDPIPNPEGRFHRYVRNNPEFGSMREYVRRVYEADRER